MTEKQDAMLLQGNKGRTYAGFNERWDATHPPEVDEPQEERLFDPDDPFGKVLIVYTSQAHDA